MSRNCLNFVVWSPARVEMPRRTVTPRDTAPRSRFAVIARRAAVAVALLASMMWSGLAMARGGGHRGHDGGGHADTGPSPGGRTGHHVLGSGASCGTDASSFGSPPSLTVYGRHSADVLVAEEELPQPVVVEPDVAVPALVADEAPTGAVTPPRPSSSGDVYEYTDARGILHFTSYAPSSPQARFYLQGRPPSSSL